MIKFKDYLEEVKKPTGKLKDACWTGYTAVGMKMKGGRKVPNCVPEETQQTNVVNTIKSGIEREKNTQALSREIDKTKNIQRNRIAKSNAAQGVTVEETEQIEEVAAWQRKEGKNPSGGLNKKGVASYRREHPGSKLSLAVTTKPSKLKPGSKAANRRKSFCARMSGMKKRLTSAKTARDPDSRINKSLRKWNC